MTTSQTQSVGASALSQPAGKQGSLGKDEFLKLLVTQLRYQDPMNPMKGTEFAAQLAQFSSVEQLFNINTKLSYSMEVNALLSKSINNALSSAFIGKEVRASADTFRYNGEGTMKLGYSLPSSAEIATVKIYDASGNLVKTVTSVGTDKGDNNFTWDGKNQDGQAVSAGKFKFVVEAKDGNGTDVASSVYIFGTVSAVRFRAEGTVFVINGQEIPLSDILEIS
jgi:flagellar basal-body rod modification protein FlgD